MCGKMLAEDAARQRVLLSCMDDGTSNPIL